MTEELTEAITAAVQWLFAPLLAIVVLAWLCVRLDDLGVFAAIRSAVRKMSAFQRFAAGVFLAMSIVFAGEKTNAPSLLPPILPPMFPSVPLVQQTPSLGMNLSVEPAEPFAAPSETTTNVRWLLRGAFEDAVRLPFPGDNGFPWRGGVATALTVFACGEFRPNAATEYFPGPFALPLSLPPLSCQDATAPSVFWSAATPSNSLVTTWENALYGRNAGNLTNFQAEFFADGSFVYRYPDRSETYPAVLPFDYDCDGLENSIDPEPEVPGPDAHGTNVQWYNTVCSNILVATEATNCVPSVSLAWLDGANSNAYYFVDVVAERGPVPICFFDASGRMPDDPVVVALAGETNRVPLVIGVEYAVTSSVPFTVSPAYDTIGRTPDGTLKIEQRESGGMTVYWPIRFSYRETTDETHFTVDSSPDGLELEYAWRVEGGAPPMPAPMLMSYFPRLLSGGGSGCFEYEGSNVTMICVGSCGCDGCTLGGDAYLMGHSLALPTFQCGCSPPPDPDQEPPGEPDPSQPSISVSYSEPAVIYEAAYVDTPDHTVPRRSTPVTLSISVSAGPHGGHYSISMPGFGTLVPTEPVDIPTVGDLEPYETMWISADCEGCSPSSSEEDVKISGTFVENETGCRFTSNGSKLTVFRVELRPENQAPANSCINRHTYGIGENVQFLYAPSVQNLTIVASGWTETNDNPKTLTCPLNTQLNSILFKYDEVEYQPEVNLLAPSDIVCSAVGFLPAIPVGGIGMALELRVLPLTVSFEGLKMQELSADERAPENWGTRQGYFSNTNFIQRWAHYECWGAGTWRNIIQGNRYGTYDSSRLFDWPQPWDDGCMTWRIPVAWHRIDYSGTNSAGQFSADFQSVWNMTEVAVEKIKHGQNLTLTSSGVIFLNSERVLDE